MMPVWQMRLSSKTSYTKVLFFAEKSCSYLKQVRFHTFVILHGHTAPSVFKSGAQ